MSNPLSSPSVTQTFGYANTVAGVLGLNNWQLNPGSYNGCKFHLITSGVLSNLEQFNPAAGAISAVSGLLTRANLIGGVTPATNDSLPYGTSSVSKNIVDTGNRKYARHRLPNSNLNVLEDLGWDGEVIKCVGLIFGSSSLQANNNLFNVIINPTSVPIINRNVLVHPVLGTIYDVLLTGYKRIHSSEYWKAIAYEFTFETSSPILAQTSPISTLSQIATAFNTVVSVYTAINSSIGLAATLNIAGKNIVSNFFQNNYNNAKINAATLIGVTKLIYTNLAPNSFVSPTLQAIDTSTVNLSIKSNPTNTGITNTTGVANSTQVFTSTFSGTGSVAFTGVVNINLSSYNSAFNTGLINGVSQVVTMFAQSVQATITVINQSGQTEMFQAVIANLEAGVVALNNVAQSVLFNLLENTTKITTKTTTTLEEIFAQYNIDFQSENNIKQVLALNTGVFNSVNLIPAGTKVVLPNALAI